MSLASALVPARPEYDSSASLAGEAPVPAGAALDGVSARPDTTAYISSAALHKHSFASDVISSFDAQGGLGARLAGPQLSARSAASVAFTPTHTQWITIYTIDFYVVRKPVPEQRATNR